MPELRYDAISGQSVIVAVERAAWPFTIASPTDAAPLPSDCPFCAGSETQTPPETMRTGAGDPDTPGWRVRVVPNLYPIVTPATEAAAKPSHAPGKSSDAIPVTGVHEVVILSPDHRASFGLLDDAGATEVLTVVRDRVREHLESGHAYVQAFVNQGRAAGASIAHPHAQIVALDIVPPVVEAALDRFASARIDLVARELADARNDGLAVIDGPAPAWSPFACGSPYGMRVAHRSTRARFDEATDAEIGVVALALRDALAALGRLLGDVAYNVVVRTAPPRRPAGEFHWHVDVTPRTSIVAGFEAGTGILVNTVPPEQAAGLLREAGEPVTIEIRLCTTIGVPPDAVWDAMADIETHTEWMADAVAITFLTEKRSGVGTEFECLTKVGPFTTTDVMTVTEWRPGVEMGIEHRGLVTGRGRFTLHAVPGDLTELCWDEALSYPWQMGGPVGEQASRPVLTRIWRANLDRLRAKAESGT